jgi:DNA-binding LacI/PurR family transcriptional regulator
MTKAKPPTEPNDEPNNELTNQPIELSATEQKAAIAREARRVTSYDVAEVAGVSQSAVSRCFKPGASVSKATYARVMQAASLLDYIPNAAARSLITRRSNMVAVIIAHRASLYYPELLAELSQQFTARGKRVLLFTLEHDSEVDRVLADVWQFQVDGVIAAVRLGDAHIAEFERRRMPLVLFNHSAGDGGVNTVTCDHPESGRTLVSRLAAAGHRRFAIIAGADDATEARERRHGACQRLAELGLPAPLIVTGNADYNGGGAGLQAIVEQMGDVPDAILCGSDVMAIGCLDCARHQLGVAVPARMSVAAFDAVEPSNWLSYNLTTLRQPMPMMAAAAAEMLCAVIGDHAAQPSPPQRRVFGAQFIEGATARLAPQSASESAPQPAIESTSGSPSKPASAQASAFGGAQVSGMRAPVAIM